MTVTLSLTEIISLLGFVATVLGIFGTIIWNLWKKVMDNAKELDRFKLEVATQYASYTHIAEMDRRLIRTEEKLLNAVAGLTQRIDMLLAGRENK